MPEPSVSPFGLPSGPGKSKVPPVEGQSWNLAGAVELGSGGWVCWGTRRGIPTPTASGSTPPASISFLLVALPVLIDLAQHISNSFAILNGGYFDIAFYALRIHCQPEALDITPMHDPILYA